MTSARICQQCGKALTADDRFCPLCGTGQIPAPAAPGPAGGPWEGILDRLARATAPRYRVLRLLGYGGMAGVYLAEEPRLGRRVALKVMAPGLMADPALVGRFEQEARTTAQLNHPNIVTIFDVDSRDGLHFFVMAFVAGRTLSQITTQAGGPLPIRAIEHWFAQAGSGLAYAHRAGIVHRDIKPGNIMVDGHANALVTDFGIAKVADEPSLTRTGFLVGTPTYMSPEQCASSSVTGASDQYSLGVVLYELLTGQPPFSGPTIAVLQAHVTQTPRPVLELRPDCPAVLAAAVERMLLKVPGDRFPTVGAGVTAARATVLPDDDPLREQLGEFAAVADAVQLPPVGALTPGQATALDAIVLDASGRTLANRPVRWVSDTPAVVSVNEEGVVYALAPGTGRVTAWCEGVAATTDVEITPVPGSLLIPTDDVARAAPPAATELFTPTPVPSSPESPVERKPAATAAPSSGTGSPAPTGGLAAMVPAARPATEPHPAPTQPAKAPRPAKRGRTPIVAGAAGIVLVIVAAVLLTRRGPAGDDAPAGPAGGDPPAQGEGAVPVITAPLAGVAAVDSAAAGDDSLVVVTADPPVEATEPAEATTQPTPPPPAPPPAAETPRTGTLRIAGTLPAGAAVTVSGPGVDNRRVTDGSLALPPGTYTVQARVAGYETARGQILIRAGETSSWLPDLQAVQAPAAVTPPPPTPPPAARDHAAAAEQVRGVVTSFVQALESRDLDSIARQYPGAGGAWRRQWTPFFENTRDVRNLVARLIAVNSLTVDGDVAHAAFTVELQYEDFRNRSNQPRFDFQATLNRAAGGWTLSELTQGQ